MASRLSIVAGLAAGVVVALVLLAGFIFVGPDPSGPPSSAAASPSAGPTPVVTAIAATQPVSSTPAASGSDAVAENFHIGQAAPVLVVPQVGGGTIDLAALKGKAVWINFMQTTCEECLVEFPLMNGFAARYAEAGLVIIAVDIREEEGAVASFAQSLNATFPLGLDSDGAAQRAWGALTLPMHFWIDSAGIVRDGALGGIGADIMADAVRKILPGVEVTP